MLSLYNVFRDSYTPKFLAQEHGLRLLEVKQPHNPSKKLSIPLEEPYIPLKEAESLPYTPFFHQNSCEFHLKPIRRSLFSIKKALHSIIKALLCVKRALHSIIKALDSIKRAAYSIKRALSSIKEALFSKSKATYHASG